MSIFDFYKNTKAETLSMIKVKCCFRKKKRIKLKKSF